MVASQMADAVFDSTTVDIEVSGKSKQGYVFRATGSIVKFTGFRALYIEARDEDVASDDNEQELILPALSPNQSLDCQRLEPDQHFTKPPARFTEASLIKVLEQLGIGRPSTYAPTIGVIVARQYVTRERGSLQSTKLGQTVSSSLVDYGFRIMDPSFTAELEEKLDEVANGKEDWIQLLNKFYGPFKKMCEAALIDMPPKKVEEPTDEICEVCGRPMVIKHGRFGRFLSCSGFPECKTSRPMLKKTGAPCPKCENGELVERKGKGRTFFGCTNYPDCTFTVVQRPLPVACPECEGLLVASGRNQAQCTNCAYQGSVPEEEPIGVV
jgi:DNA topoisomerase-1